MVRLVAATNVSLPAPPVAFTLPVTALMVNESLPVPPTSVALATAPMVTVKPPAVLAEASTLRTVASKAAVTVKAWSPVAVNDVALVAVSVSITLGDVTAFNVNASMPATCNVLAPVAMPATLIAAASAEPVTPE